MRSCKPFKTRVLIHGDERMHFPRLNKCVGAVATLAMICLLPVSGLAQGSADTQNTQTPATPMPSAASAPPSSSSAVFTDYSNPRSHFFNPIAPYQSRKVAPPVLSNTSRIQQVLLNGKLMLSLDDAIAIALENNLDIAIARYNLPIADTDIMLANAGQATRGVNTGVVQGTPGGGIGGIGGTTTTGSQGGGAGGTTTGAGGAGTGSSGLVTSTLGVGSVIPSFDPIITGTLQIDRNSVQSTSAFSGVPFTQTNTGTANFSYTQGFHW